MKHCSELRWGASSAKLCTKLYDHECVHVHTPLLGIETSANYAQNYTITARDSECTFTPPLLGIEMGCLERTLATDTPQTNLVYVLVHT